LCTALASTVVPITRFRPPHHAPPPSLHSFPTRRSSDLPSHVAEVAPEVLVPGQAVMIWQRLEELVGDLREHRQEELLLGVEVPVDRKSTRLNSSHVKISYAVFCLKKKKLHPFHRRPRPCRCRRLLRHLRPALYLR